MNLSFVVDGSTCSCDVSCCCYLDNFYRKQIANGRRNRSILDCDDARRYDVRTLLLSRVRVSCDAATENLGKDMRCRR